jgi:hypothetical protein
MRALCWRRTHTARNVQALGTANAHATTLNNNSPSLVSMNNNSPSLVSMKLHTSRTEIQQSRGANE